MSPTNLAFNVFPAIDLLGGRCVRLLKGDYAQKTEYSADPVAVARQWVDAGAAWLHVVDLDAAKAGQPVNTEVIRDIMRLAANAGVSVQVGGGIRTVDTLQQWRDLGVNRCVVGTAAQNPDFVADAVQRFGADALVIGLDGRRGKLAVNGWQEQTETSLVELASILREAGARHALVTDVERDGTLAGANLQLAADVQAAGLQAIASGGIRSLEDVLAAREAGLAGVIAGKSLYEGTLSLADVIAALEGASTC